MNNENDEEIGLFYIANCIFFAFIVVIAIGWFGDSIKSGFTMLIYAAICSPFVTKKVITSGKLGKFSKLILFVIHFCLFLIILISETSSSATPDTETVPESPQQQIIAEETTIATTEQPTEPTTETEAETETIPETTETPTEATTEPETTIPEPETETEPSTEAGKNRIVPLPPNIPELKEFLKSWIDETPTGERFFPHRNDQFRQKIFREGLKTCGITDSRLTPHSTRHTFASLSAAAGMQPENLQKIIGHASFSTTAEIYIHQDFETLQAEMSKIKK